MIQSMFDFYPPVAFIALFTLCTFSFLMMKESIVLGLLSLCVSVVMVLLLVSGHVYLLIFHLPVVGFIIVAAGIWAALILISLHFISAQSNWMGIWVMTLASAVLLGGYVWFGQTTPNNACSNSYANVSIQNELLSLPVTFRADVKGQWTGRNFSWQHTYSNDERDKSRRNLRSFCAMSGIENRPIDAGMIVIMLNWQIRDAIADACQDPENEAMVMCLEDYASILKDMGAFVITNGPIRARRNVNVTLFNPTVKGRCHGGPGTTWQVRCSIQRDYADGVVVLAATGRILDTTPEEALLRLNRFVDFMVDVLRNGENG